MGKIGEMNGKWALLFKAALSIGTFCLPFVLAMQVWVIQMVHDLDKRLAVREANQFTMADWAEKSELFRATLPPKWVQDELKNLRERMARLESRLDRAGPGH